MSTSYFSRTPAQTPDVRASALDRYGLKIGVGFIILGLLALATAWLFYDDLQVGSICGDGWISDSINSGRCSSHDGVAEDVYENTPFGVSPDSWINVSPWRLGIAGLVNLGIGGAFIVRNARRSRRDCALETDRLPLPELLDLADPSTSQRPTLGVVELTARVHSGGAGRTVEVSVGDGQVTRLPFFFRNEQGRAAPRLSELMRTTKKRRFGRTDRGPVEAFGAELFTALFPEPALSRYREALAIALQTNSRLRLLLDLDERTSDLPWEYLYDAERASFLAMSTDTSVIRQVVDGGATRSCAPINTLRVLVMTSSPRGLPKLDADNETAEIAERMGDRSTGEQAAGRVDVHRVDGETFEDLRQALVAHEPHVFHFVGHGTWDEAAHEGAVAFADDHGSRHAVTGRDLGVLLNRPGLRLVLFNSCNAARTSQQDRFAGVAGSLVAQGVPAAIGMQYPIEDRSAASFGSEFLGSLVATRSIDTALTNARAAVYTAHNGIEWATPVMTTRVPVDDIIPWA